MGCANHLRTISSLFFDCQGDQNAEACQPVISREVEARDSGSLQGPWILFDVRPYARFCTVSQL